LIGAQQLATILIIGFGLHNMTEGFGIAGALTGQRVAWKCILLLGLLGGGPTFLGTAVGLVFQSQLMFIFCLALAAGAIISVGEELLDVARCLTSQEIAMWVAGWLPAWLRAAGVTPSLRLTTGCADILLSPISGR
jgi:zinc transporter, ZIP family